MERQLAKIPIERQQYRVPAGGLGSNSRVIGTGHEVVDMSEIVAARTQNSRQGAWKILVGKEAFAHRESASGGRL